MSPELCTGRLLAPHIEVADSKRNPRLGRNLLLAKQFRHPLSNILMFKQTSRTSAWFWFSTALWTTASLCQELGVGIGSADYADPWRGW